MLKKIAAIIAVLIVLFLGFAATRPDTFRVERSAVIQAAPGKVFALVNDFHDWPSWSPWEKMDPDMKRSHGGSAEGKGAVYAWEGNKEVGQGRMEILESVPSAKVLIKLEFIEPFKSTCTSEFTLASQDGATTVTWAMHGANSFLGKCMSVFCNMDKMVGKDFETGLANIKALAEKPS